MTRRIRRAATVIFLALCVVASVACSADNPQADVLPTSTTTSVQPTSVPTALPTSTPVVVEESPTSTPVAVATPEPSPTTAPQDPTPVPTPPAHPWYECEFVDYAVRVADYRVANIPPDDPDGGLVTHVSPGVAAEVIEVLADGLGPLSIAGCQQNLTTNSVWWLVDGRGWVNARYLESYVDFEGLDWQPGLSEPIDDDFFANLIGIEALDLDTLAQLIGDQLAEDPTVIMLGNFMGVDARGGIAGYDVYGLRDDSVAGYRLRVIVDFVKDADANEILGFRVSSVTGRAICQRGVSDGLCV